MRVNSEHEAEDAIDVQSQDQLQARESIDGNEFTFIGLTVETRRSARTRTSNMKRGGRIVKQGQGVKLGAVAWVVRRWDQKRG